MICYKINANLYLNVCQVAQSAAPAPVDVPTNHILVVDCSGSMGSDLPRVRDQLKRKLPKMVGPKDTISIVWFSGRGQCGILLEAEPVATLVDLAAVNTAIDRWLRPVGLTGFREPLELVGQVADRLAKANPLAANALVFMSDGFDNQGSRPEILKAIGDIAGKLNAVTVVEYGYYADRALLAAIAEKGGGVHIFADSFDKYTPVLEASLSKKVSARPRVAVDVPEQVVGGFAYALSEGDILTFTAENGIHVPEGTKSVAYLTTYAADVGPLLTSVADDVADKDTFEDSALDHAYAAISLFATRMDSNTVFALLKAVGDVAYISSYTNCYGKQAYSAFQQSAKLAAFSPNLRFIEGYDPNKVPREDAFTVLELLSILAKDEGNRLMLDHPSFSYARIGRGSVDASTVLTSDEQADVDRLTEEMVGQRDAKKVAEIAGKIAAITDKPEALKFTADLAPEGYEVGGIVWNEERPNVSVRVRKTGTVDLSKRTVPSGITQNAFPTFIFRNYAIIKDGLVNVEVLPVRLTNATKVKLIEVFAQGRTTESLVAAGDDGVTILNIKELPVINRQMVKATSARDLFNAEWELTCARAAQKVYKAYKEELIGKRVSKGWLEEYGPEATEWLKEVGLTDYSGFNPKSVQAEATDFYVAKEMSVSIKSFSTLPTLKVAREKKAKGKMTPSETLLVKYIEQVESVVGAEGLATLSEPQKRMLNTWLEDETKAVVAKCRELLYRKAVTLFAVLVGQTWFSEFSSLEQNSMELTVDGQKLACKVELNEKEVKV